MKRFFSSAALALAATVFTSWAGPLGQGAAYNRWRIVYGAPEGPEMRAIEVLSRTINSYISRPQGYSTYMTTMCVRFDDARAKSGNLFLVGTPHDNPEIAGRVKEGDVPKDGYLVRTLREGDRQIVLVAGDTPAAALYAAFDFIDDGLQAMRDTSSRCVTYDSGLLSGTLPAYESRRAPQTPCRSCFTWGHVIDDYEAFFEGLARMRLNEVILWNQYPPLNAAEVVACAHSWGVKVLWGFTWGWSTSCGTSDFAKLKEIEDKVFSDWEKNWKNLPGDGIYFQTFTEGRYDKPGEPSVASAAVRLVNAVAARIRQVSPDLRIIFGLHAEGVKNRLDEIDMTDRSIAILWENCGRFPLSPQKLAYSPDYGRDFVSKLLAQDRGVGLALKGQLLQDWNNFKPQTGPFVLGRESAETLQADTALASRMWEDYNWQWIEHGDVAYALVKDVHAHVGKIPPMLNVVVECSGPARFATALAAELFWSTEEPYDKIFHRVYRRRWVLK